MSSKLSPQIFLVLLLCVLFISCREKKDSSVEYKDVAVKVKNTKNNKSEETMYSDLRRQMVERQIIRRGVVDRLVVDAMLKVPRHRFVPDNLQALAYNDTPLPVGENQTISQPYIVAYMTEAIQAAPGDKVLEIGTGSGYQAAVLAEIVKHVYSMEIICSLAERAASILKELDYTNVDIRCADGYKGWPQEAPFDAIIVTAAPEKIPVALKEQLKIGGRMVIPVGRLDFHQELLLVTRTSKDSWDEERLLPVRFVPMTGKDAEP